MENRFAEISVSFHFDLLPSCLSIDAFCEEAPRQFLRDGHACSRVWTARFAKSQPAGPWTGTIGRRNHPKSRIE